jgi:hypothetical protein
LLRNPRHDATTANSDTAERRAPALALRASQPQQPRYLGEFAETADTFAIRLQLPIPATPF